MATYPAATSVPRKTNSVRELNGVETTVTDGGTILQQDPDGTLAVRIEIFHELLTQSERDTLMSFYATNKALAVDLTVDADSVAYSCFFDGRPVVSVSPRGPLHYDIRVTLVGTEV